MENMLTIALEVECVLAKLGEISFEPLKEERDEDICIALVVENVKGTILISVLEKLHK